MIEYIIKLKRKEKTIFTDGWVWRMAWRDARHNFSRLFLFAASLITGIAAIVGIGSLNYSLKDDLDRNARELVGADLVANGNKKFEKEILALFDSMKVEQASGSEMASMALFVNSKQSRLIRLMALGGDFPFYGKIETVPPGAFQTMKTGGYALVDEPLAIQYEISTNDTVKLGNTFFRIAGYVKKFPGASGILQTFTPSVYITHHDLDSTGLVQFGSRVNYRRFFKTANINQTKKLEDRLRPVLKKYGHWVETVESRKEGLGRTFNSVYRFFSLLAFVALILGCIGVASCVHIYVRGKRDEVAVLRCIGSSGWQAFNIFFIQVVVVGIMASILGAGLGVAIQQIIPLVFKDFIPGNLNFSIAWKAVGEGFVSGTVVSLLFSALPLLSVRFVPPLAVLRADVLSVINFSKAHLTVISLMIIFPVAAASFQTKGIFSGLLFTAGLSVALGCLALVASGLLKLAKRFFPETASFTFRHALSNLFRPNNQTHVLMVTIGLGAFIFALLSIVQTSLLNQVEFTGNTNQSNAILFDIQPRQKEGVIKLISDHQFSVNQVVPIVTCRLSEIRGKSIEYLQNDTASGIPNWALTREYRVTYRDSLHHSEELIKGKIHYLNPGKKDSVYVTLSEGFQESLKVEVGDSLVFDVQGLPVKVFISGIRKVDWPKDPPNFIFVFPKGVIDQAPQVWVTATRLEDSPRAAKFQQELITLFPNVSMIDLRLVLSTINEIFRKIGLVVKFLALFSIVTGLVVLGGAVINSKFARIKENVLLRTLGARTKQITSITLTEYAYLGFFSSLTGILLSIAGGFILCKFYFEVDFSANFIELGLISLIVVLLTILIGWWNSRAVINTPPLQVLRKEN